MAPRMPRSTLLTSLLATLALTVGGGASAFWSGSGDGNGSATTGTTVPVILTVGTPTSSLFPGGTADVALTVSNPNLFPVHIGSFALSSGQGAGGFGASGCLVAEAFLTFAASSAGWTAPAKVGADNGALPVTLTNALAMGVGAANACQGATFTVYLTAGP
jgi:hypothetical protein